MKDRIITRNLLSRKHVALDDYNYAICTRGTEETLLHLSLDYPFVVSCWATLSLVGQNSNDPFQTYLIQKSA
jgi:hypothetical protein